MAKATRSFPSISVVGPCRAQPCFWVTAICLLTVTTSIIPRAVAVATVTPTTTNRWNQGCGLQLNMQFQQSVTSWEMRISFWNARPSSVSVWVGNYQSSQSTANSIVITNKNYNGAVSAGMTMTMDMNLDSMSICDEISGIVLNGATAYSVVTSTTLTPPVVGTIIPQIMNTWNSGCSMRLRMSFSISVTSWEVRMDFSNAVSSHSVWVGTVRSASTPTTMVIGSKSYNSMMSAGSSMDMDMNLAPSTVCADLIALSLNDVRVYPVPSTNVPTPAPTAPQPTSMPTSSFPTDAPVTSLPTQEPTSAPMSSAPSILPSTAPPSLSPGITKTPTTSPLTLSPTNVPSSYPTLNPSTASPTVEPTTARPTTLSPTHTPTTPIPTMDTPSEAPTDICPLHVFNTSSGQDIECLASNIELCNVGTAITLRFYLPGATQVTFILKDPETDVVLRQWTESAIPFLMHGDTVRNGATEFGNWDDVEVRDYFLRVHVDGTAPSVEVNFAVRNCTGTPTEPPTISAPTETPSGIPTAIPTRAPTAPTTAPSAAPTAPTGAPSSASPTHSPSSTPTRAPTTPAPTCAPDLPIATPQPVSAGISRLPRAALSTLLLLVRNCNGNDEEILAHSGNNQDWNSLPPKPASINCIGCDCTVDLPVGSSYCIKPISTENVPRSADAKAARLLSQATFGPRRQDINHINDNLDGNPRAWLDEQIRVKPTFLRERYRKHISPKQLVGDNFGGIRPACEAGSRWHGYLFGLMDRGKTVDVRTAGIHRRWYIDGKLVSVMNSTSSPLNDGIFTVCELVEFRGVGSSVFVSNDGCSNQFEIENPLVTFETGTVDVLDFSSVEVAQHPSRYDVVFLNSSVPGCTDSPFDSNLIMSSGGLFYRHDPRVAILENTLENPADDIAEGEICPAAEKSFLNKDFCVKSQTCGGRTYGSAPVPLNNDTFRNWYVHSNRYVYIVTGLRLEDPYNVGPCTSRTSRWKRTAGNCLNPTLLDTLTQSTIVTALSESTDPNPFVRDIQLTGDDCVDSDATIGAQVQVGQECFEHIHPHELDVRDFSYWVIIHDGNPFALAAGRSNPIAKWAIAGETQIHFPANHPLTRWNLRNINMPIVGRYGDTVDFAELDTELQTSHIADMVGASAETGSIASEACGSPGEIANSPVLGHWYYVSRPSSFEFQNEQLDYPMQFASGKSTVWSSTVLDAEDQLRQRIAWTLSQIFVVSDSIGRENEIEPWVNYYDIFVRHAFGNYRDIMKEVSYSPIMAAYLTYLQNKAFAFSRTFADENYAREIMQLFSIGLYKLHHNGTSVKGANGEVLETYTNEDIIAFARIWTGFDRQSGRNNIESVDGDDSVNVVDPMQIKPIWRDRQPKTKLDEGYIGDGFPLCHEEPPQQFLRKGAQYRLTGSSSIEGSLADQHVDLPSEVFQAESSTMVGATAVGSVVQFESSASYIEFSVERSVAELVDLRAYYFLFNQGDRQLSVQVNGATIDSQWTFSSSSEDGMLQASDPILINLTVGMNTIRLIANSAVAPTVDFISFGGAGAIRKRLQLDPSTSSLHQRLCNPGQSSGCTFPLQVTLENSLPCDGIECDAGRVLSVLVVDPINNIRQYYQHISSPCVNLALFDTGHVTKRDGSIGRQCTADSAPMSVACCSTNSADVLPVDLFASDCLYVNEAVSYTEASRRCSTRGGSICTNVTKPTYFHNSCAEGNFVWTSETCRPKIQIYPDRRVGLVDPVIVDTANLWYYMESSGNNFAVRWDNNAAVPSSTNGCGTGCNQVATVDGSSCVCDVTLSETAPFSNQNVSPTVANVEQELKIGAWDPTELSYEECADPAVCSVHVRVWTPQGTNGVVNRDAVFELPPKVAGGSKRYLLNRLITVAVAGQPQAAFRNPPAFMPGLGEQTIGSQAYLSADLLVPQAEYEVDALLDHLFEHQSTAPFVVHRLIQQMVTSNPSPDYVSRAVTAFETGAFLSFGTGSYGDLEATVAAILLDPEARTSEYDADPTFGHAFEPIMKVIASLRALDWTPSFAQPLTLYNSEERLGMEAFNAPSVFSFYRPEFSAPGKVLDAGLVSPELELSQAPLIISYMDGMISLVDNGLSSCDNGFGTWCFTDDQLAGYEGAFSWTPMISTAQAIVDELSLLLTQDRLHPRIRQVIVDAYNSRSSNQEGLSTAIKLVMSSPEFHVSSMNLLTNQAHPEERITNSGGRPFKAIVVLFMNGGCDSFNLLVPHSQCIDDRDYYEEYRGVRTSGAYPKGNLLPINSTSGSQPCDVFGIHASMTKYKQLYDDGDGAFVANIGSLVEPVTKDDYDNRFRGSTKEFPPSLFAHNAQQVQAFTVHPQNSGAKGVLAKIINALRNKTLPFKSELFSIDGNQRLLEGTESGYNIITQNGQSNGGNTGDDTSYSDIVDNLATMMANESDSIFADTYSKLTLSALQRTSEYTPLIQGETLNTTFARDGVSRQLETVAKLIKLRNTLQMERAVFVVEKGRFDTHDTWNLDPMFDEINTGLSSFVDEMKAQNMWDNVVFYTVSDFARTLTANSRGGSDHGWGGNHFIAGGDIDGGRILGKFPDTLDADGPLNVGRGRLIPTFPWDSIWEGIAEWFDVNADQMSDVLPNRGNFGADKIYTRGELFSSSTVHQVSWGIPATNTSLPNLQINVNDQVMFQWSTSFHDVTQTVTLGCDYVGSTQLSPPAGTGSFLWTPPAVGVYNFACTIGNHCTSGMNMQVMVSA